MSLAIQVMIFLLKFWHDHSYDKVYVESITIDEYFLYDPV